MNKELAAVFDEHAKPTHCSKRALHDQMLPVSQAISSMQAQLNQYRALLSVAELTEHPPALDTSINELHQTLGSLDREGTALFDGLRRLTGSMAQWDRYMLDVKRDIERAEAGLPLSGAAVRAADRAAANATLASGANADATLA